MKSDSVVELRHEFAAQELAKRMMPADPLDQFRKWLAQALQAELHQHNAMTLATVGSQGRPSARMVLLNEVNEQGFVFYTSYESQKGQELAQNPQAALLFGWSLLYRQVRIEGQVSQLADAQCDAYFATRPRSHQLACWAWSQSQGIAGRSQLLHHIQEMEQRYGDGPIPRPASFGGYCLTPSMIDFWQGRLDWVHDWLRYTRQADGRWQLARLSP